jgi:hypothetical protein
MVAGPRFLLVPPPWLPEAGIGGWLSEAVFFTMTPANKQVA